MATPRGLRRAASGLVGAALLVVVSASVFSGAHAAEPATERDRVIGLCERLLVKRSRKVASTHDVEVVSDSPNPAAASVLASDFDAVFHVLSGVFLGVTSDPSRHDEKVRAYLFRSARQYARFDTTINGTKSSWSSGSYVHGAGVLVFHLEMYVQPELRHTMIHECTHAYVDRVLCAAGHRLPPSLDEGLAEYVAISVLKAGKIHLGSYEARTRYANPTITRVLPSIAAERLAAARTAARWRKQTLSLRYLFDAPEPTSASQERTAEFYAVSWLLIDFLRHGRPEWSRGAFPLFMEKVGTGERATDALDQTYGIPPADLEREFREYVKDFRLPLVR